jgi:hypothetical protein
MAKLNETEQAISDHAEMQRALETKIVQVEYFRPPYSKGTLCVLTLLSGFKVTGDTACADEADGQGLAYTAALNKLWDYEVYLHAEIGTGRKAD